MAKGLIKDGKWNEWARDPLNSKIKVDHWNEFVSWDQLLKLQKKAYRMFYLRPTSIWNMIKRLRSFDELWIKIKGGLDVLGIKNNLSVLKNKLFKSNNKASIGSTRI